MDAYPPSLQTELSSLPLKTILELTHISHEVRSSKDAVITLVLKHVPPNCIRQLQDVVAERRQRVQQETGHYRKQNLPGLENTEELRDISRFLELPTPQ
jgi:hypothetical protein